MKLRTIALATLFALSSTFAIAEENPATGAQAGATGVPGVKTNPTPEEAAQGGTPGAKTPGQATSGITGANTSGSANRGTNGSNPVESDKVNAGSPTGPTPIK
jgi:hypothetical protein